MADSKSPLLKSQSASKSCVFRAASERSGNNVQKPTKTMVKCIFGNFMEEWTSASPKSDGGASRRL
jgi:hypothetical protein